MPPPGSPTLRRRRRPRASRRSGSTARSARPGFPNVQLPQLAAKLNWRRAAGESKDFASLAAGRRSAVGDEFACKKQAREESGGGGRTRTYEGLASGFTVRPLCRSGHSPFGAWPEAKTPRTSRGAIGPPYLSPAPPCQLQKRLGRRGREPRRQAAAIAAACSARPMAGGAGGGRTERQRSGEARPDEAASPERAQCKGDEVADASGTPC